jgi:hypothetical protein
MAAVCHSGKLTPASLIEVMNQLFVYRHRSRISDYSLLPGYRAVIERARL